MGSPQKARTNPRLAGTSRHILRLPHNPKRPLLGTHEISNILAEKLLARRWRHRIIKRTLGITGTKFGKLIFRKIVARPHRSSLASRLTHFGGQCTLGSLHHGWNITDQSGCGSDTTTDHCRNRRGSLRPVLRGKSKTAAHATRRQLIRTNHRSPPRSEWTANIRRAGTKTSRLLTGYHERSRRANRSCRHQSSITTLRRQPIHRHRTTHPSLPLRLRPLGRTIRPTHTLRWDNLLRSHIATIAPLCYPHPSTT